MLPSSAELLYFIEVANTLNLSRASERIGISQPSLSIAIKKLEKTIGTDLFIRHKHGVMLTQAGKQLLIHARQLLQYWDTVKSEALASEQEIKGYFTLGCNSSIAIYSLRKILPNLLEKHNQLEIQLKHDISRKITEQVIKLSIDIGLVINPIKHADLVIKKLGNDEVTFWVGPGNRKIQDIHSKHVVLLCDMSLAQTQVLLKKCKNLDISFNRIINMNSLDVVANLTANGCGVGILPARVATASHQDKLTKIPNMPAHQDELCLIYRNEHRNIQAIQVIINSIKECIY